MQIQRVTNNNFCSNKNLSKNELPYDKDFMLLDNNLSTRTRIGLDKLGNSLTLYPAKGLKGSKNSNFYEFLTMGVVPYLVGSGTLMAVFNLANKFYAPFSRTKANKLGQPMALGVLFYGIMKNISKSFVTKPVKWLTGIDTEVPYVKRNYELPDNIYDTDVTSIEYHKAYESKDFPFWELFYKSEAKGENRNEYYDKVAQKLGLGENLKDSDQEVKPLIKKIAVKTDMAKTISSYLWAAVGVGLAFQKPFEEFFNVATLKFWKPKAVMNATKTFVKSTFRSVKTFVQGGQGIEKYAGKALLGLAIASTVLGVINAVSHKGIANNKDYIDKNKDYIVS